MGEGLRVEHLHGHVAGDAPLDVEYLARVSAGRSLGTSLPVVTSHGR